MVFFELNLQSNPIIKCDISREKFEFLSIAQVSQYLLIKVLMKCISKNYSGINSLIV